VWQSFYFHPFFFFFFFFTSLKKKPITSKYFNFFFFTFYITSINFYYYSNKKIYYKTQLFYFSIKQFQTFFYTLYHINNLLLRTIQTKISQHNHLMFGCWIFWIRIIFWICLLISRQWKCVWVLNRIQILF